MNQETVERLKMSSGNSNIREKSPSESHAEVIVRMFPSDANPAGNVFGGEILKHIDMVAGIVAQRQIVLDSTRGVPVEIWIPSFTIL